MAKTEGALFSLKARGSLGNVITYQGRRFFQHVHRKAKPFNPNSPGQQRFRTFFAVFVAEWQGLSTAEKAAYDILGEKYDRIPGFNYYLRSRLLAATYWVKFGKYFFGEHYKFGGP